MNRSRSTVERIGGRLSEEALQVQLEKQKNKNLYQLHQVESVDQLRKLPTGDAVQNAILLPGITKMAGGDKQ